MIELRDLRFLLTVAHEQDLGRAARRLNMGQAPLAHQLRELERSLGVVLFERTKRRMELTRAGEALADGARRTLSELDRALDEAQRTAGVCEHALRVHASPYAAETVATELLRRFREGHVHAPVEIVHELAESPIDAVQRRAIDVAFVLGPVDADVTPESGLRALLVHRERFHLALPCAHPLVAKRQLSLRGVADEPLVVLARETAPRFHELIASACQGAGFPSSAAVEVDGFEAMLAAVQAGEGVAFLPASFAARPTEGVEFRPLIGMTATADIAMLYRSGDESIAVQMLVETGRELAR